MIKATARYMMREHPENKGWIELFRSNELSPQKRWRVWKKLAMRGRDPHTGKVLWFRSTDEMAHVTATFESTKSWEVEEAEATMILFSIEGETA